MGDVQPLRPSAQRLRQRDLGIADARQLIEDGRWSEAWQRLKATVDLEPSDLELRGSLAYLLGDARSYFEDLTAAFEAYDDPASAARCACWLGIMHLIRGEAGHSAGWMASARRLVDEHGECAASSYLEVMAILGDESPGRDQAIVIAEEVNRIARRHDDVDAVALTGQTLGHLLIRRGRAEQGRSLMDEAMVSAISRRLSSPLVEILVYLAVMAGCRLLLDVARAREWTTAMDRLRSRSPELNAFAGVLTLCRAELIYLAGKWDDALAEVGLVTDRPLQGEAAHLRGEILRLRGEYDDAAAAYAEAAARGRDVVPGLAQLHLAKGEPDLARAVAVRALDERNDPCDRALLLPAAVAAAAPVGTADAGRWAAELTEIARLLASPLLEARARQASGLVALYGGDPAAAVASFRQAGAAFLAVGVPAEQVGSLVLTAEAYRRAGEPALAVIEHDAAVALAARLGMRLPHVPVAQASTPASDPAATRLSARELDVLRRVAAGATNREIAAALTLSPRTVDRHVSNILTKIDLTSRVAAAAYAVEHGLV